MKSSISAFFSNAAASRAGGQAGLEIFHFYSRVVEQIGRMCFKTN
jgi:hypothetical protein